MAAVGRHKKAKESRRLRLPCGAVIDLKKPVRAFIFAPVQAVMIGIRPEREPRIAEDNVGSGSSKRTGTYG